MRQKIFDRKFWHSHPPSYPKTFSLPETFWNTAQKGSSTKCFGTVRQKIFDRKSWYSPLLSINFLATGNFLKHSTEGFPYEIFRHCETKNFRQKIVILPSSSSPFLSIDFFDTRNFVKHRRVPLRSFSVLWDNKFSIENRDIPLIGIKFFDTRN